MKNDGGVAFPSAICVGPNHQLYPIGSEGMTLRDYFAAKALSCIMSFESFEPINDHGLPCKTDEEAFASISKLAYKYADCMIAERDK